MQVLVLGAGLAGVTSAWYLNRAGCKVTVVDRQPGAGLETSFANGGQISISHPEPWANPSAPATVLRWLGREDAPLLFRLTADPAQWRWGLAFLRECLPGRTARNTSAIAHLAAYSREQLAALRADTGITYDHLERGILHLFFDQREFSHAPRKAEQLREFGIRAEVLDIARATALEPAIAHFRKGLAGALYGVDDESGDAHLFCRHLAGIAAAAGVDFRYGLTVRALEVAGGELAGVVVRDETGHGSLLRADAVVMALGSYSPLLANPLGERLPIYPVKGYSVTAPVLDPALAPSVSLTDESRRIVCSRLGDRLRIAGTAELAGYDTQLRSERARTILNWLEECLPGAADTSRAELWTGLRPATPSNLPIIGKSRVNRLFFNTGHGTLGWTLACGSARALADIMTGHRPEPDFPFHNAD
ncbi:MAG: D-amino acid dehydrogenase [Zoogloea sp.]|nr:D-amino acid dehydrogenase [Zoogloea sp.]